MKRDHGLVDDNFFNTPFGSFYRCRGYVVVSSTSLLTVPEELRSKFARTLIPPVPTDGHELGVLVVECAKAFCTFARSLLEDKKDRITFCSKLSYDFLHGLRFTRRITF